MQVRRNRKIAGIHLLGMALAVAFGVMFSVRVAHAEEHTYTLVDDDTNQIYADWDEESETLTISGHGGIPDVSYYLDPTDRRMVQNTYIEVSAEAKKVVIGEGVTSIGDRAFLSFSVMTDVEIPNTVASIGVQAFGRTNLRSVRIPGGVTDIERWCFSGCSALTDVEIEEGVTSIGLGAFQSCDNLESITIPDSATNLDSYIFEGCSSLMNVRLPKDIDHIPSNMFRNCTSLTSFEVPDSVTEIGQGTFEGCTSLVSVRLPSINAISLYAFYGCSSLTYLSGGYEWVSAGRETFWVKDSTNIYLFNASKLQNINYDWNGSNRRIALPTKTYPLNDKVTAYWCNENDEGLLVVSGSGAMPDCVSPDGQVYHEISEKVKQVVIDKGITSIGDYAFCRSTALTGVSIPSSVTGIGKYAFSGCSALTRLVIPDGVTGIGENAFYDCPSLMSIIGGSSVTAIGQNAWKTNTETAIHLAPDASDVLRNYIWSNDNRYRAYYVIFEANGGSAVAKQFVRPNGTAAVPGIPTKETYVLDGWCDNNLLEWRYGATSYNRQRKYFSGLIGEFDFDTAITEDTVLYAKWVLPTITGTATIVGEAKYGETLTVELSEDSNAVGTEISYCWKKKRLIPADPEYGYIVPHNPYAAEYTITEDDIGWALLCEVGSHDLTGTFHTGTTEIVVKADGPAAPTQLAGVEPTNAAKDNGKIIGTNATMEYSTLADFVDVAQIFGCSEEETIVPAPGVYYVRVKETAGTKAGTAAAVTVGDINVCTATFDVQGHGQTPNPQLIVEGGKVSKPAEPSEVGYVFGGWYRGTDYAGGSEWDFGKDVVTDDLTLYAKWTAVEARTWTVAVAPGANMVRTADSGAETQTVAEGNAITEIRYTAASGYYFPENYASLGTRDGIDVERTDGDSIRIAGTPTANVTLTLVATSKKANSEPNPNPEPNPEPNPGPNPNPEPNPEVNRDGLVAGFALEAQTAGEEIVTYNASEDRYEIVYTGGNLTPVVNVTNDGEPLTVGVDYTIKYSNNRKVSSAKKPATVTITGKGSYIGSKTLEFYVVPKKLANDNGAVAEGIAVGGLVIAKGGKAAPVVLYNGVKLGSKDYTVAQNGEESVDITGQNNYTGTIKGVKLTVLADSAALKQASIKVAAAKGVSRTYTGLPQMLTVATKAKEGELTVTNADGAVLAEGTDFAVSYGANINAGTVKVTVTGLGTYTGSVTKTFKILPAKDAKITAKLIAEPGSADGKYSFVKTGVMPKLAVTAVVTGVSETGSTKTVTNSLTEGVDYKVTYKNNKAVSTDKAKASYVVTFLSNYKGAKLDNTDTTFTITEASLKDAQILVGDILYNVKNAKYGKYFQKPNVVLNGALLAKNEYTVAYYDDKNNELKASDALNLSAENPAQVIRVKISASAKSRNYKDAGSLNPTATYTVRFDANVGQAGAKVDISKAKITLTDTKGKKVSKVQYTGKEITFDPANEIGGYQNQAILTVTIGNPKKGGVVLKGAEVYKYFNVSYANNVAKGKATIILTPKAGESTYIGVRAGSFSITAANVKTTMRVKIAAGTVR